MAERFAADVQRRLAAAARAPSGGAGGPEGSAAALRVAVTVHTDEAMFIYSQPDLLEDDGAQQRVWSFSFIVWRPSCCLSIGHLLAFRCEWARDCSQRLEGMRG